MYKLLVQQFSSLSMVAHIVHIIIAIIAKPEATAFKHNFVKKPALHLTISTNMSECEYTDFVREYLDYCHSHIDAKILVF